ncbi:hypothetical protein [Actinoplanes subglobosus]|uniref:Uncharacterized protein n=1 Tax=Actinoplanes subglobosus TaxID=1547892 RepID=A0ABV8IZ34_9ACTN
MPLAVTPGPSSPLSGTSETAVGASRGAGQEAVTCQTAVRRIGMLSSSSITGTS